MSFLPTTIYMALRQYMQAAEIVTPAAIVSGGTVAVNIGLNQLLIWGVGAWPGLGFVGSPVATPMSMVFQL
jgi:MATE family multidrug resistance protein